MMRLDKWGFTQMLTSFLFFFKYIILNIVEVYKAQKHDPFACHLKNPIYMCMYIHVHMHRHVWLFKLMTDQKIKATDFKEEIGVKPHKISPLGSIPILVFSHYHSSEREITKPYSRLSRFNILYM